MSSDDRDDASLSRPDRRRALGWGGAAVALSLGADATLLRHAWATPRFKATPFSLGIASGDPATDGFVIWTRLAPEPLKRGGGMPARPVGGSWEIAADEAMTRRVASGTATARPEHAHSVHVEVAGLEPGRDYFYRFEVGGAWSPVGRGRTLPAPRSADRITVVSAGCQRYEDGHFTAWRHIATDRPNLVIHYGDYIYEYKAIAPGTDRAAQVVRSMPGAPGKCLSLDDFRNRYAIYKLDPDLQAAHAAAPFVTSFDDHEVENDWAGFVSENSDVSRAAFANRRSAAFKAWYEHMPLRKSQAPRGPDILAYRRLRIGDLAQFDILDTRQYRSPQVCDAGWAVCPAAREKARTMLGRRQEEWLRSGLSMPRARWHVLAQQVPMARHDRNPDPAVLETNMDKWDGATAARDRLFSAVNEAAIARLVVLSGDVHQNRAYELHRDFDAPARSPLGVEFVATSISSGGDGRATPANAAKLLEINPHLKFVNAERGYVRHTISRDTWTADYVTVGKVSSPDGRPRVRTRFVVESGDVRLQAST